VLLAVTVTGWASPAQATTASYPNPACTIPQGDYYDFYDDCAAYMNWGKYIPDGFIKSGSWFVDLPTALGDTISALSYDGKTYIQGVAHGTEMGFNFHEGQPDCYNPTEPGAWDDDLPRRRAGVRVPPGFAGRMRVLQAAVIPDHVPRGQPRRGQLPLPHLCGLRDAGPGRGGREDDARRRGAVIVRRRASYGAGRPATRYYGGGTDGDP